MSITAIFFQGFLACIGLIMVIGSQNAFILRHGIRGDHLFLIATVSLLGDLVLIGLGVNGLGTIIQSSAILQLIMVISGSVFLIAYGFFALYSVWQNKTLEIHKQTNPLVHHRKKIIILALTFSLLNPHAWLDAAVILGGIGGQLHDAFERHVFTAGALAGSALWFYGLAYFALKLAPILQRPRVWQFINLLVAFLMWGIAYSLIKNYLQNIA